MRNHILKGRGCGQSSAPEPRGALLQEAHSTGSLAGTESPQQWADRTHSQSPSGTGPDEPRLPGDGTSCFEALPSSWEDVLAAQEGLGVRL